MDRHGKRTSDLADSRNMVWDGSIAGAVALNRGMDRDNQCPDTMEPHRGVDGNNSDATAIWSMVFNRVLDWIRRSNMVRNRVLGWSHRRPSGRVVLD